VREPSISLLYRASGMLCLARTCRMIASRHGLMRPLCRAIGTSGTMVSEDAERAACCTGSPDHPHIYAKFVSFNGTRQLFPALSAKRPKDLQPRCPILGSMNCWAASMTLSSVRVTIFFYEFCVYCACGVALPRSPRVSGVHVCHVEAICG